MASLVTALETDFTPAAGDFIIQVTVAPATLLRKNASAASYTVVQDSIIGAWNVSNPVAGAVYRFRGDASVVRADQ